MEFLRLGIVYLHLIACCVAVGSILTSDAAMAYALLRSTSPEKIGARHLVTLAKLVSWALVALWVTGLLLLGCDTLTSGTHIFDNPKLQAKIIVVILLSANGWWLHAMVLPRIVRARSVLKLSYPEMAQAAFVGTVSGVSWCYAVFLGVARNLAWKYPLWSLLVAYPVLVAFGFFFMMILLLLACLRMVEAQWAAARKKMEMGAAVLKEEAVEASL